MYGKFVLRIYSYPLKARSLLLLSFVTKVSKSTLCFEGPKEVIITVKVLYELFLTTISAHLCGGFQLVLIGDYSISTLCFLGGVLPYLCLKYSTYKPRRSFLLSPSDVNRLPRFAVLPLYLLTTRQSLVAGFTFQLVFTGGVCC